MATDVIMPALEMAQETGVLVSWLKHDGETVTKGEPLMEIETDKVTVEIEAPASGTLGGIRAKEGDAIPVGQTIAWILGPGEAPPLSAEAAAPSGRAATAPQANRSAPTTPVEASPLARKMAEEHGIDLEWLRSNGKRIEKADVLAYINTAPSGGRGLERAPALGAAKARLSPASPKARRLAAERGIELSAIRGSGPEGAVLVEDVPLNSAPAALASPLETPSTAWRVMAEHMTTSWTGVPHFHLMREVDASQLMEWRTGITPIVEQSSGSKPTYTDLLVKLCGVALREHPRLNAAWADGKLEAHEEIGVGIAVATEEGLLVPVIRHADTASVSEIAGQRKDLVERAQTRKLRPADLAGGTFTITNLGMYKVDAFQAIVNAPQAAILAVGRIAERVVPVDGQAAIRPMMILTLSCDHRVVDGARGAEFLDFLANLIEHPLSLLS